MEELINHFLLRVDESRAAGDDLPVHSVGVNAEHKLAAVFAVLKRRHSLRDLLEIRLFAHLDMQCGVSPCAESRTADEVLVRIKGGAEIKQRME